MRRGATSARVAVKLVVVNNAIFKNRTTLAPQMHTVVMILVRAGVLGAVVMKVIVVNAQACKHS